MRKRTLWYLIVLGVSLLLAIGPAQAQQVDAETALRYLRKHAVTLGMTPVELVDLVVTDQYVSRHNGVTHIYFQQRYNQIPVHNALINLSIAPDGQVLSVGNRFVPGLQAAAKQDAPSLGPSGAVDAAARKLNLQPTKAMWVEKERSAYDIVLSDGGISLEPIPARLVYLPLENRGVFLAWNVLIYTPDARHYWNMFIDAGSGEVLFQEDLVLEDRWDVTDADVEMRFLTTMRQAAAEAPLFPLEQFAPAPPRFAPAAPMSSALYRVYAHPSESPSHAGDPTMDLRTLVSNPADPTASPFGWHDTDGAPGAEFTRTRGNNVHAYTDVDANNLPDPGSDPDGGAALHFDFPLDLSMSPATYRPAAVVNLFYWNNLIHDVMYHYGFDEASGNFQVNNYGKGGVGGDDVRAEAQDGSGTNNANFATGVEGVRPRMQMFVWTHPFPNIVTVNSPAVIAGDYPASGAAFGPTVAAAGPITGDVAYVGRGCDPAYQLGQPLDPYLASPAGKIALIDRGSCTFTSKVKKAQDNGALAVIVANIAAGNPITMGGADPTITIPSVMVSLDNGNLFKSNAPVNATLKANPVTSVNRDSDFDNGVIVHEYGHGISNRLTGGPNTVACLSNQEQMGEGWSDYFALVLTDTNTDNRGIGTYVIYQPTTGGGIRPFPYSTSFGTNPATYDAIKTLSIPHGVGFVWASMLWDMTRALVDKHGFDTDIYSGTGGNNLALQLVTDGLKIQPCSPGFVDGRNAILAADVALTGGGNQCLIWDAFARRGLGFSANQGLSSSRADGTEAFDLPVSCCTFAILAGKVTALQTGGVLNKGQASSLLQKLANAERQFGKGQSNAAINILNAFLNEVNALRASGRLTAAQAQELIDCALGVINRIQQATPSARFASKGAPNLAQTLDGAAQGELPDHFALSQNYPNPFNPATEIAFALPENARVRLTVYDVLGREVARLVDGELPAGYHRVTFEGSRLATGMYFYRMEAGSFVQVKQMILVK